MLRRRNRARTTNTADLAGFAGVLARVEEAKATLLLGIPSGRRPRLPMAEALMGFEHELTNALSELDRWQSPAHEGVRTACREGLADALRGAERLRLEGTSDAYEDLVPALDGLLDPLEVFTRAEATLRRTGR